MRYALPASLASLLCLAALPALACSWGDPSRPLQDEIRGYYDADVVFLAKIGEVGESPPMDPERFWMSVARYEVLEVYRGNPASDGVVASEVHGKVGLDGAPPNSCTGGAISAANQGSVVLVFANQRVRDGSPTYYKLDRFRTLQTDNCKGCDDILERMRQYGKAERVPLVQDQR